MSDSQTARFRSWAFDKTGFMHTSSLLLSCLEFLLLWPGLIASNPLRSEHRERHDDISSSSLSSQSTALAIVPSRATRTRRASTSLVGGFRMDDLGDGWLVHYQPLEALMPSENSIAVLEDFYIQLMGELKNNGIWHENLLGNDLEVEFGELELRIQSVHNIEWPVVLNFLSWVVRTIISDEHPSLLARIDTCSSSKRQEMAGEVDGESDWKILRQG